MEMDIGDLLREAARRANDENKGGKRRMHPLAQGYELLDRYRRSHENVKFPELGTVLVEKKGFSNTKNPELGEIVYVLWDKLDITNPVHKAILDNWANEFPLAPCTDCIVAFMPESTSAPVFRPHGSAYLEPLDMGDAEAEMGDTA